VLLQRHQATPHHLVMLLLGLLLLWLLLVRLGCMLLLCGVVMGARRVMLLLMLLLLLLQGPLHQPCGCRLCCDCGPSVHFQLRPAAVTGVRSNRWRRGGCCK
jgi:hypothetical protein